MTGVRPLTADVRSRLLERLKAEVAVEGLDGILLLERSSVIWATGFDHSASERPIGLHVPLDGEPTLFVPLLEREHAEEASRWRVEVYEEFPGWVHPVPWMVDRVNEGDRGGRLGVDALDARVYTELFTDGAALAMSTAAERARAVKEPEELDLVRAAARYADICLRWILENGSEVIREGERTLLEGGLRAAREQQSREVAGVFEPGQLHVVGTAHSGPRAALPHGRTTDRVPASGEVLIAGIGARVGGYHAESGATFVVGEPTDEVRRLLSIEEACGLAAQRALRPGQPAHAVNEAAMEVLRDAGLSDFVRHRIGHGMGVDGHEAPWLAPGDATVLGKNMVYSCEPGIYRPGRDGYRTIDTLIVTDDAPEVPSTFQRSVPWHARVIPVS